MRVLLQRNELRAITRLDRSEGRSRLLHDRIEHDLRAMPLMLGAEWVLGTIRERVHLEAAELVAAETRHEDVVQRMLEWKTPIAHAHGKAEAAQQLHAAYTDLQDAGE